MTYKQRLKAARKRVKAMSQQELDELHDRIRKAGKAE